MYSGTEMREAMAGRARAAALHRYNTNVNLVDVGWRYRSRRRTQELAVRVHVLRKLSGAEFESLEANRPQDVIDAERIGFPCDVIECCYHLHSSLGFFPPPVAPAFPFPPANPRSGVFRPLRGGVGISRPGPTVGTLGGIVRDRASGQAMILSNFHVLAGSGLAQPGLATFQPAQAEGGAHIGALTRHAMDDDMDAAVAALNDGIPFVNDQLGVGPVEGVAEPELDMVVTKSGRTTHVTEGIVDGVGGIFVRFYPGFDFPQTIRHIAHVAPLNTANVSAGGDSGSWWLEASSRRAVALHFAGSDFPDFALGISMPKVVASLDIDLAI
jgi:endonuclease G